MSADNKPLDKPKKMGYSFGEADVDGLQLGPQVSFADLVRILKANAEMRLTGKLVLNYRDGRVEHAARDESLF